MPTKKLPAKRKHINPDDFHLARRSAGLDKAMAADMLDVTEKTIMNWEAGKSPIPYAAFRLMRLAGGRELTDKGWEGWAIHNGKLYSPSGRSFAPYELYYLSNHLQMARYFIAGIRPRDASADRQHAQGAYMPTADASSQHVEPVSRDEASCATAQAGARPRHDANVIYVSFSKQKGGEVSATSCDTKEQL